MSPVEFQKRPCRLVGFQGRGLRNEVEMRIRKTRFSKVDQLGRAIKEQDVDEMLRSAQWRHELVPGEVYNHRSTYSSHQQPSRHPLQYSHLQIHSNRNRNHHGATPLPSAVHAGPETQPCNRTLRLWAGSRRFLFRQAGCPRISRSPQTPHCL